ncbi:hypothetical protein COB52_00265 [Candidatus Kaiserbacteria bacterium]|nr:MAG: hypothetical protein COB52_00265 [Candidatus Kaiserbacteria bacterium]
MSSDTPADSAAPVKSNIEYGDPQEEVKGEFAKIVSHLSPQLPTQIDLPEVKVVTGEESEECIFKMRARLFRYRDGMWKERGTGDAKLLRHKESKMIRFILR